uniref:AsmA family protein n=1 Tax=Eiseniibacteriota bacterium TaxID=2212470 RepID=A0A832I1L1_UNCEI
MPTALPRPARLALVAAAALVALLAIGAAAVALLLPPARVRALIEAQLAGALARPVRFEGAAVGVLPPVRLTVRRLALAEPGGFERGTAFEAEAVALDADVLALLLQRKVVVRRLVLERPSVHLLLRADGTTNFDGLLRPAPPGAARPAGEAMDLDVRDLEVRGANLLVDDVRAGRRTALGLSSRLSFASEKGGALLATAGETRIAGVAVGPLTATRMADLNRGIAAIEWRLAHRGKFDARRKRLALERLALSFGRATLEAQGIMDDPGPRAAVDFGARGRAVDLAEVLRVLSTADARALAGLSGGGRLDFDLRIAGRFGPGRLPDVTGALGVVNGAFRYAGAPAGVTGLSFNARFAPDSLGIPDLAATVAGQPVRATLEVRRFEDPVVRFGVRGNVDLAAVAPLVAPKDTKLSGRADVNVAGAGRAKDPGSIALTGAVALRGVTAESPALPKRIEAVNGDLSFSPERAVVRRLTARAGASSFALDATVTRPLALMAKPGETAPAGVRFAFASEHLDLAELLPSGGGGPVLPNARGGGTVAIGRLRQQRLDVRNVRADVALEPGVLGVPAFALDGYGGAVRGDARFDLTDPAVPVYRVRARVDSVQADALLSAWTPARGLVQAALSTTLDLSGAGLEPEQVRRSLTAVGLAALANGQLGPGPSFEAIARFVRIPALREVRFKDARLPFRVERGRMITNPVHLSGPYGEWTAVGSVGFDGSLDYAVSVTLPPAAAQALDARSALAAGALADDQGRVLLDLRVTGPARAPRVAWDPQAMRDRLAGRASQAIAGQRAKLAEEAKRALSPGALVHPDSLRRLASPWRALSADSAKKGATDLIRGFFGGGRRAAAPAPAPAPGDSAARPDSAGGR